MMIPAIFFPTLIGAFALAILGFGAGACVGWIFWRRDWVESRELLENLRSLKDELSLLRKRDS